MLNIHIYEILIVWMLKSRNKQAAINFLWNQKNSNNITSTNLNKQKWFGSKTWHKFNWWKKRLLLHNSQSPAQSGIYTTWELQGKKKDAWMTRGSQSKYKTNKLAWMHAHSSYMWWTQERKNKHMLMISLILFWKLVTKMVNKFRDRKTDTESSMWLHLV